MNRRGFMGSILALGAAPAIVRADSLMRIVPTEILVMRERPLIDVDLWAGAIRECMAHDIRWDRILYRYDVMAVGVDGVPVQWGVDIDSRTGYGKEIAIATLRDKVRESGARPVSGILKPMDGLQTRFL